MKSLKLFVMCKKERVAQRFQKRFATRPYYTCQSGELAFGRGVNILSGLL